MAASQPFGFVCQGGLNTNTNELAALATAGVATELVNFEVDSDSGYRRVNGYTPFGTARPNGDNRILGLCSYAGGLIAAVVDNGTQTDYFFTMNGTAWAKINKDGVDSTTYSKTTWDDLAEETRAGTAQPEFTFMNVGQYGEIIITDGNNLPFLFKITGTGSITDLSYHGHTFQVNSSGAPQAATFHETRYVAAIDNVVYTSGVLLPSTFTGSGVSVQVSEPVVALRSFRDDVIIFCKNSIHKLSNINNADALVVKPITENVGCIAQHSVQEIGGDLVFLSPDGIRTVAGTARIGDVELGAISRPIQPLFSQLARTINNYIVTSTVIRNKNQYRIFYAGQGEDITTSKGIIGTLTKNGFEWSETEGIQAHAIVSNLDLSNVEVYFHGDKNGYVYSHDIGPSFYKNGAAFNINSKYVTPFYDFGDVGSRKTLHYVKISVTPESTVAPTLSIKYDYNSVESPQPPAYQLTTIPLPSLFGTASFGSGVGAGAFGGIGDPMVRQPVQGSGHTANFTISNNDQAGSYRINGFFIDYVPAGRR